jgi:hypothetical protein
MRGIIPPMKLLGWPIAAAFGLLALALRVLSLGWNERLQGDINLFALTARELVQHGRLAYPMVYEYTGQAACSALTTPASQHPPAWPFIAGAVAGVLGTDDTFAVLKAMSLVAGLVLLTTVWLLQRRSSHALGPGVALGLMALSPLLVDYSANGSMYVAVAIALVLCCWSIPRIDRERLGMAAAAGAIASLAVQTHGIALTLPLTLGLVLLVRRAYLALSVFAGTGTLLALPYLCWNLRHFGVPFHSVSSQYLGMKLGLLSEELVDGRITLLRHDVPALALLERYAHIVMANVVEFARGSFRELGPFCLSLVAVGLLHVFRTNRPLMRAGVLTFGGCLATMLLWGEFQLTRFLVPLLPACYLLAGAGSAMLWARGRRWALGVCLLGALGWMVPAYLERPPTRYYSHDANYARRYAAMKRVATRLAELPRGTVLGYAISLDGGIEAIYYHRMPFVRGRRLVGGEGLDSEALRTLAADCSVRYVWVDAKTQRQALRTFGSAQVRLEQDGYAVLELP